MTDRVIRRLTMLKDEAQAEPVPTRKFFHIGQPEMMDDLGEAIPMIAWVTDNLSRYVVSNAPSSAWGSVAPASQFVLSLPNRAVSAEDGIFLVSGGGTDSAVPNPSGKGQIHFIHLHAKEPLWNKGLVKIYIYRLEGVQLKSLLEKPAHEGSPPRQKG